MMKTLDEHSMTDRIIWLDHLRGISIFFVVFGHTVGVSGVVEKMIFSFHMPIFFWISGLVCKSEIRQTPFPSFLKEKARKLLIPYLFFSVISYMAWVLVFRHFGTQASLNIQPLNPLLGIIYGNGIHNGMVHNTALWFFLCLFVTELLFYWILRLPSKRLIILVLVLLSVAGYVDVFCNPPIASGFRLPWNIDIALTAIVFYGAGYLSRKPLMKEGGGAFKPAVWVATSVFFVIFSQLNTKVALVAGVYGNYIYFYIAAFSGIFFWRETAALIPVCRPLIRTGQETLVIFAMHLLIFPLLTGVQVYIFRIPSAIKQDSLILSLVYTLTSILILLPVSNFMNRYAWFVLGKKKLPGRKK